MKLSIPILGGLVFLGGSAVTTFVHADLRGYFGFTGSSGTQDQNLKATTGTEEDDVVIQQQRRVLVSSGFDQGVEGAAAAAAAATDDVPSAAFSEARKPVGFPHTGSVTTAMFPDTVMVATLAADIEQQSATTAEGTFIAVESSGGGEIVEATDPPIDVSQNIQGHHHHHLRRSTKNNRVRRSMQTTTLNNNKLEMTTTTTTTTDTETENSGSGGGSNRNLKAKKGYNHGNGYGNRYGYGYGYGNNNNYGNSYLKNDKAAKVGKTAKNYATPFFVTPSTTLVTPPTGKAWKAAKDHKYPKTPYGVPQMIAPIFPGPKTKATKYHKNKKTARPLPQPQPSPPPTPEPVLSSTTNANVNVPPEKDNEVIEQELLDATVKTLGGTRRLVGATVVSVLEEHDEDQQEHRKLIRTETMTVSTGTATIRVGFIAEIACDEMFGNVTPPVGNVCRDFSISITLTGGGGDQQDVNGLIETVDVSINTGTFATNFCTVLRQDQVDDSCSVVTAPPTDAPPAPTNAPMNAPTNAAVPTNAPTTASTNAPSKVGDTNAPTNTPTAAPLTKAPTTVSTNAPKPIQAPEPTTLAPPSNVYVVPTIAPTKKGETNKPTFFLCEAQPWNPQCCGSSFKSGPHFNPCIAKRYGGLDRFGPEDCQPPTFYIPKCGDDGCIYGTNVPYCPGDPLPDNCVPEKFEELDPVCCGYKCSGQNPYICTIAFPNPCIAKANTGNYGPDSCIPNPNPNSWGVCLTFLIPL